MPKLTQGNLNRIPIIAPPLTEQRAIAHVLGTLDDLIELNRETNEILEEMARALFKSWFVDFDPVRAKLEGRPPAGMDAATAALFPDHFQDSELGQIPKGWEVRSLDEIAHFLNGLALQKYPANDGDTLPVIKIAQLRKGDTIGADRCNTTVPPDFVVKDGDVLFSWSGTLAVEIWCGGAGALNQHLFKVTSEEFPKWFCYFWTLHHLEHFQGIAADKAVTMGHIKRGHLTEAKVIVPSSAMVDSLSAIMSPFIDSVISNRIESRDLANLRDTLLPKLLSGEISAPVAEELIASHT
jgi:type I restriction enzyme S subunit